MEILKFKSPLYRINRIVHCCYAIKKSQLYTFFSDANISKATIDSYVSNLVGTHYLTYYKAEDMVISRSVASIDDKDNVTIKPSCKGYIKSVNVLKNICDTLWIVASYGSTEVESVSIANESPAEITFLTEDMAYKVVKVRTDYDAYFVADNWRRYNYSPKNASKEIDEGFYRIALVDSHDLADEISGCGFDCYCILDENNVPFYYEFR
mgnify:CR=1 FL=1